MLRATLNRRALQTDARPPPGSLAKVGLANRGACLYLALLNVNNAELGRYTLIIIIINVAFVASLEPAWSRSLGFKPFIGR